MGHTNPPPIRHSTKTDLAASLASRWNFRDFAVTRPGLSFKLRNPAIGWLGCFSFLSPSQIRTV